MRDRHRATRGERTLTTRFTPIRWHSFDRATFELGRTEHRLPGPDLSIALYSPERSIIDAFRLRYEVGADAANEALKRWLRRDPAVTPAPQHGEPAGDAFLAIQKVARRTGLDVQELLTL